MVGNPQELQLSLLKQNFWQFGALEHSGVHHAKNISRGLCLWLLLINVQRLKKKIFFKLSFFLVLFFFYFNKWRVFKTIGNFPPYQQI